MREMLLTAVAVLCAAVAAAEAEIPRPKVVFFRGITVERDDAAAWLGESRDADVTCVSLETKGSNYRVRNQLVLKTDPEAIPVESAATIVLGDWPLFEKTLPLALQARIMKAVKDGGCRLVVMGGPFSLNKCGNLAAPVLDALPVVLGDKWAVEFLADGRQVSVVTPRDGAVVSAKSPQGNPLVVEGTYGRGKVVVACASVR